MDNMHGNHPPNAHEPGPQKPWAAGGASRLGHAAARGYGVGVGKAAGGITFIAATFPQVQGV